MPSRNKAKRARRKHPHQPSSSVNRAQNCRGASVLPLPLFPRGQQVKTVSGHAARDLDQHRRAWELVGVDGVAGDRSREDSICSWATHSVREASVGVDSMGSWVTHPAADNNEAGSCCASVSVSGATDTSSSLQIPPGGGGFMSKLIAFRETSLRRKMLGVATDMTPAPLLPPPATAAAHDSRTQPPARVTLNEQAPGEDIDSFVRRVVPSLECARAPIHVTSGTHLLHPDGDDGGASAGSGRLRAALLQGMWVLDGKTGDAERHTMSRNSVQKLRPSERLAAIVDHFGYSVAQAEILDGICAAIKDGSSKEQELLKVARRTGFTRGKWVIFASTRSTKVPAGSSNRSKRRRRRGGRPWEVVKCPGVDHIWAAVARAVHQGRLGPKAMVSFRTKRGPKSKDPFVISVWTNDCTDEEEVGRLAHVLVNECSAVLGGFRPDLWQALRVRELGTRCSGHPDGFVYQELRRTANLQGLKHGSLCRAVSPSKKRQKRSSSVAAGRPAVITSDTFFEGVGVGQGTENRALAQALDDSVELDEGSDVALDESSDVEPGPEPSAAAEPGPEPCAEPGPKSQAQSVSEAIEQGLAKAPWNQSNSSQPQ